MKTFTSLTLIIILIIVILNLSILSTSQHGHQDDLIHQTCKKTPYYGLCLSILLSTPKGTKADVPGLGLIIIDNTIERVLELLQNMNKTLLSQEPGNKDIEMAVMSCAETYNTIVVADLEKATAGLTEGVYKFAKDSINDAVVEVELCGAKLAEKAPQLNEMNKWLHAVSLLASAIVRMLLS